MNDKLYYRIDADEEMSDTEKRETYRAEIQAEKDEREWQDGQL